MTLHTQDEHAHDHGLDMWISTDQATRRAFATDYWAALCELPALRELRRVFARSTFTLG